MRKDSYIETKRRLSRCFDIKNMSDKEIIEVLDNEIKQYRERIEQLQEQVKELYNREIKSETITLDTTEEEYRKKIIDAECSTYRCAMDYGMEEHTVIRWYEDGVLIKEEIKPANEDKKK
jgi:cell division septum initiation protein DivIVA|nr:MAG TPA: protein of unknown function (DUF5320) [Caudoviricetes sp.]